MAGGFDPGGKIGARGAVGVADETKFDEVVGAEGAAQLGDELGREAVLAQPKGVAESLAEGAELGFLRAGEGRFFHVEKTHDRRARGCKPAPGLRAQGCWSVEAVKRQLAPRAGGEGAEIKRAEARAVEGEDFVALTGEHTANLMVATLREGEFGLTGGDEAERGGSAGRGFVGEDQRAGGKECGHLGGAGGRDVGGESGAVEFGDFVLRGSEAVDEGALIGEENQAGSVLIKAADARDDGIAALPTRREEAVDIGPFAEFVGADEAEGFVEQEQEAVGVVERLAPDADIGGVGFLAGAVGGLAAHGDGPGVDPIAGFAAGAVAEIGKELVEAAHGSRLGGGGAEGNSEERDREGRELRRWEELRKGSDGARERQKRTGRWAAKSVT